VVINSPSNTIPICIVGIYLFNPSNKNPNTTAVKSPRAGYRNKQYKNKKTKGKIIRTSAPTISILLITKAEITTIHSINAILAGFVSLFDPDTVRKGFCWGSIKKCSMFSFR
jgi:hypothetical protein